MSSIERGGHTFHGISADGRGVFTGVYGMTYAGQCKDGCACGLGVTTLADWHKVYAEHGPDGKFDGRYLDRDGNGDTGYCLYERGRLKEYACVYADGRCKYNYDYCARDDPRLLVLIAQVAPVEVRPAARSPHPLLARHSPPSNRPMDRPARSARPAGAGGRRGHRGAFPCRTPSLVAVRHKPTAAALYRVIVFPRSLLAGLRSFGYPVRVRQAEEPWPTCHGEWRCACTAATKFGGVLSHEG
jgi:hypothetical protein